MKLISSYPRSGSAKLKLLLCHLQHPQFEHDFHTINKFIPSIDSEEQMKNCAATVQYLCTHSPIRSDIFLYRHVGDVLISEYWYQRKYYDVDISLQDWIIQGDYGDNWRKSIEAGRSAPVRIAFEMLSDPIILSVKLGYTVDEVKKALEKCSFEKMAALETTANFGGDPEIKYMRSGKSHQWLDLDFRIDILRANEGELEHLGYWSKDDWEGLTLKQC